MDKDDIEMEILNSIYKKVIENVPDYMPETGGMLGGQDGIINCCV